METLKNTLLLLIVFAFSNPTQAQFWKKLEKTRSCMQTRYREKNLAAPHYSLLLLVDFHGI